MAAPENIANSSIPGQVTALTTLAKEVTESATEIEVAAKPPVALESAGQFHIVIGSEILLVTGGQKTTKWIVSRKQEGTTAQAYSVGTSIFHFLTANALQTLIGESELVKTAGLASEAVTSAKVAKEAIAAAQLAAESVIESKLGKESVTESKIGKESVTTPKMALSTIPQVFSLNQGVAQEVKNIRAGALISWRRPVKVTWNSSTEGGFVARLSRDGVEVINYTAEIGPAGTNEGYGVVLLDYIESVAGTHTYQIAVEGFGTEATITSLSTGHLIVNS